ASRGALAGKPPASVFQSLLGGMGELIDTLAQRIETRGGQIRIGARVAAIAPGKDGARFSVRVEQEETLADEVILCTPAYSAADALDGLDREISALLRQIPYLSTATVVCGYHRIDVPHALDAAGLIVPKGEGRRVLAATFISSKWAARAPSDCALLR